MTSEQPQPALMTWRAHPARQRPRAACAAGAVVIALASAAGWSFGPLWGLVAVCILFLSLSRFFLASRFSIDVEGITARYPFSTRRLRWGDARRFVQDSHGGYLSTRSSGSVADGRRGVHLLFDEPNRARAVEEIRRRMVREGREPAAALADGGLGSSGGASRTGPMHRGEPWAA